MSEQESVGLETLGAEILRLRQREAELLDDYLAQLEKASGLVPGQTVRVWRAGQLSRESYQIVGISNTRVRQPARLPHLRVHLARPDGHRLFFEDFAPEALEICGEEDL
ncbi:MAG: hypothetical protein ACO1RX_02150 [Candidatus Sericytochromatia bacterium]